MAFSGMFISRPTAYDAWGPEYDLTVNRHLLGSLDAVWEPGERTFWCHYSTTDGTPAPVSVEFLVDGAPGPAGWTFTQYSGIGWHFKLDYENNPTWVGLANGFHTIKFTVHTATQDYTTSLVAHVVDSFPAKPTNPTPADTAVNISIGLALLDWEAG